MAHGEHGFPAAAGLWLVYFAGDGGRSAVRSAAPLPPAAAPADGVAGPAVLPCRGKRGLFVPAAPGGSAADVSAGGYAGRCRGVLLCPVLSSAAGLGLLGGHPGSTVGSGSAASALGENFLRKNVVSRKKSLLFCSQMLYNKENPKKTTCLRQRRAASWRQRGRKKSIPGQAC